MKLCNKGGRPSFEAKFAEKLQKFNIEQRHKGKRHNQILHMLSCQNWDPGRDSLHNLQNKNALKQFVDNKWLKRSKVTVTFQMVRIPALIPKQDSKEDSIYLSVTN